MTRKFEPVREKVWGDWRKLHNRELLWSVLFTNYCGGQSCTRCLTSALGWSGWLTPRPGRFTPGKQSRYPLYRRLGGPQDRSGRVRKISTPPGIRKEAVLLQSLHALIRASRGRSGDGGFSIRRARLQVVQIASRCSCTAGIFTSRLEHGT